MSDKSLMNKLFDIYKVGVCKNTFMLRVREAGFVLSGRETGFIWDAFDRAAEEWEPRFGGM
jgi:hypothetical protein